MSTKTKGDILAERIAKAIEGNPPMSILQSEIRIAINEYYKPWTLGRSVNGFTLGDGQEWHRNDWTEDMLPDGWRPHIIGERNEGEDYYFDEGRWHSMQKTSAKTTSYDLHLRTRRPLPQVIDQYAELKAAHKAGKTIQWRYPKREEWLTCTESCPPQWLKDLEYRIKPEPKLVPLGPEDVTPGCVFRKEDWPPHSFRALVSLASTRVCLGAAYGEGFLEFSFAELKEKGFKISRDNGKTWERCEKEAK